MYNYFEGVVILIKFSFKYIFTYKKYFFSILFSAFVLYIINFITPYIKREIDFMSYLVCHIQKFKNNDVKGLQIHNQRESDKSKNIDIDKSKSHLI